MQVIVQADVQDTIEVGLSWRWYANPAHSRTQDGAYADVTVKLGIVKLLQKEFDLCEEA